jgi:hypothetical protein
MLGSYVLYDLGRRQGSRVGLAPDAERFIAGGAEILPDGGCWVPEGDAWQVVLRDSFNRFVRADPQAIEPLWEVANLDSAVARRWCPVERHAPPDRNRTVGPFRVRGSGTRRVTITDGAGARTFAVHRKRLTFGSLLLGHLALGPDQRRLAYTITPALGSFVGNPRSFVVDQRRASGGATSLAAPAYALAWSADGSRLYGLVGRDSDSAIYVWGF